MTIASKAVGTVLGCTVIGGLIGAAVLPLVGIPDGFITGALSGSIGAIAFLISDWS
jgi:hypothetical protein